MATEDHCAHCFDSLEAYFKRANVPPAPFSLDAQFPLFVTWNKVGSHGRLELRGCIGVLMVIQQLNLAQTTHSLFLRQVASDLFHSLR